MDKKGTIYIGVIGSGVCDEEVAYQAYEIGRLIAEEGAVLVCGGRGGVMEAAARGAREAGGIAVGILPGIDGREGNEYLSITIPTGLGDARNAIIARTADAVIAVCGGFGTLSEIGLALKMGKPVIGLNTWEIRNQDGCPLVIVHNPRDAVNRAIQAVKNRWR